MVSLRSPAPDLGPARRLVAIAASAGGVVALRRILCELPAELGAAVAIVQHRPSRDVQRDPLVSVLQPVCKLPVRVASEGELVVEGTVYLAPSDQHLTVTPMRTFHLVDGQRIRSVRSSANPLFETAARVYGSNLVAVVLTGGDGDATDGVQTVASAGGMVIAQDPTTALASGMPRSAIETGAVSRVLPLDAIASTIVRLAR